MNDAQLVQEFSTEVADAKKELAKHREQQRVYAGDSLAKQIRSVIQEYEGTAANALHTAKDFRDRMLVDLRAFSIVVTMAGNASTHREKDARLRGLSELLESAIDRLAKEEFDIACCKRPLGRWDDPFRSDFPTRHFVQRIHELEDEIKRLQPPDTNGEFTKKEQEG